ncbi:hypothetical protein ACFZBU_38340 [Embleya sp. NPDC008237]|uniref:hypothetical protein n=1 Tax=Embleya sp. NPDC008237 TaxID=3363978 RepID=UPI0036E38785
MRRIIRHATTATATAVVVAFLLAAGCDGGDDGRRATSADPDGHPPAGTTSVPLPAEPAPVNAAPDTGPLETAVRAYTARMFAGDGPGAYTILSTRCQGRTTEAEYNAVVDRAKKVYGVLTVKTIKIDRMDGDQARVTYAVGVPTLDRQAQPWTLEAGTWRWDAC